MGPSKKRRDDGLDLRRQRRAQEVKELEQIRRKEEESKRRVEERRKEEGK